MGIPTWMCTISPGFRFLSNLRGTKPLLLGFRSGMSWNLDPARFADNEAGFQTLALRFFALTIHSRHYQLSRQFADLANGLFDGGQWRLRVHRHPVVIETDDRHSLRHPQPPNGY